MSSSEPNTRIAKCNSCKYEVICVVPDELFSDTFPCFRCREGCIKLREDDNSISAAVVHYDDLRKAPQKVQQAAPKKEPTPIDRKITPSTLKYLMTTRPIVDVEFDAEGEGKISFSCIILEDGTSIHFNNGYAYWATYERNS